jgi:hypothetical protein
MKLGNTGRWFLFDVEDESQGGVKIRLPMATEEDKLDWGDAILDWNNVEDDDGNLIEYSKEKANELMKTSPMFIAFVTKFFNVLNQEYLEYRKILEKN